MTLQTLTGRLQELCHHGHAQDDVAVVVDGTHYAVSDVDLREELPGETWIFVEWEKEIESQC